MSGGSMDYLCHRIENDANFRQHTPERRAFAAHLKLVTKALHDIEWVDSCDYGLERRVFLRPGDENEAIRACLGPVAVLEIAIEMAQETQKALQAELERAKLALGA